jgi:flagellar hook-associated protein 1 FlgK
MSAVNTLQDAGYDLNGNQGTDFFSGTGAADIQVAITDPKLIAASSTQGTGGTGTLDGSNADAMASIANSAPGPNAVYRTMVAGIGVASQDAIRRQGIQSTVAQQADSEVAAESGVNLDEEMANMLTYQRAYEAAAKVFTTIDSTLDTLINHIGL